MNDPTNIPPRDVTVPGPLPPSPESAPAERAGGPRGSPPGPARPLAPLARAIGYCLLGLVVLGITAWGTLAVCFADLSGARPRYVPAAVFAAASLASVLVLRPRRYRALAFSALFATALAWFFTRTPSNHRDWAPDVAELAWAELQGDQVTLHNVRNFDYRSTDDFSPRWEERQYDLSRLKTADFILVYWGSPAIAHAIASFGFDDGRYLAVSIETRKERAESYSALQGFFRQYELIYVFADERDVLRLRTNYRGEDVYLYRTRITPDHARAIFLSYLDRANALRHRPEFYNALTTNCATSILPHVRAGGARGQISWEVLLSGYAARQAHRNGVLDDSIPYDELRSRSCINAVARDSDKDAQFSQKIRAALPIPSVSRVAAPEHR